MDNTTAVAYLNHMGGTVAPLATEIAKDLWMWCLEKDITLSTTPPREGEYNSGRRVLRQVGLDVEPQNLPDRVGTSPPASRLTALLPVGDQTP